MMKMKETGKKSLVLLLTCAMLLSLTACTAFNTKNRKYTAYVTSLLDANYKGEFDTFISMTDSDEEAVQVAYDEGIEYLADALIGYYGIEQVDDGKIRDEFIELTKKIYAASKYEVKTAVKSGNSYTVEVLIYPMDILQTTYDDVISYITTFNNKKEAGYFDEYEIDEYETEFAEGILKILNNALPNISYGEPTSTMVTILIDQNTYYISDEDFTKLDSHMIATVEDTSERSEETTEEATVTYNHQPDDDEDIVDEEEEE